MSIMVPLRLSELAEVSGDDDNPLQVEAGVLLSSLDKARDKQARANKQRYRERELEHEKRVERARVAAVNQEPVTANQVARRRQLKSGNRTQKYGRKRADRRSQNHKSTVECRT